MDYTQFDGHTPGDWRWEFLSGCGHYSLLAFNADGTYHNHVQLGGPPRATRTPDQLLTQAAPALLADNAQLRAEVERLRAALDKLTTACEGNYSAEVFVRWVKAARAALGKGAV